MRYPPLQQEHSGQSTEENDEDAETDQTSYRDRAIRFEPDVPGQDSPQGGEDRDVKDRVESLREVALQVVLRQFTLPVGSDSAEKACEQFIRIEERKLRSALPRMTTYEADGEQPKS